VGAVSVSLSSRCFSTSKRKIERDGAADVLPGLEFLAGDSALRHLPPHSGLGVLDGIAEELPVGLAEAVDDLARAVDGERVDALVRNRDAEIGDFTSRVHANRPGFVAGGRVTIQMPGSVARAYIDIAGLRNHQRAVDGLDAVQKAQRLHVAVHREQHKQVAAPPAGGAVERAVGRKGERADGRLVRRNDVHRRIAQIAQVDAHLAHHRVVVVQGPLPRGGNHNQHENRNQSQHRIHLGR
jgi:hypothetical protein